MNRYCLALDLIDDSELIQAYDTYHQAVWPDIKTSIRQAGILDMSIYRVSNRLFMIMETDDSFNFTHKAALDAANPVVQRWETLMEQYQLRLPQTPPDQKWVLMEKIFQL